MQEDIYLENWDDKNLDKIPTVTAVNIADFFQGMTLRRYAMCDKKKFEKVFKKLSEIDY